MTTKIAASPQAVLTADEVYAQNDGLGALLVLLPELSLSPGQKKALSGYLFREGPGLVLGVLSALETAPELFPAEAPRAGELRGRLHRAMALRTLSRLLGSAARRAGELALCDQAEAVRGALSVMEQAHKGAELPGGRKRLDRLRPALHLLEKKKTRARRGRADLSERLLAYERRFGALPPDEG